jgi:hypothetical protein
MFIFSSCEMYPSKFLVFVSNYVPNTKPVVNGLCTGGLRAKVTSSSGKIVEIPNVELGKGNLFDIYPTIPYGTNQTITIEAWCKTQSGTEGYSKRIRNGSNIEVITVGIHAPDDSNPKSEYEVISPGPMITD